MYQESLLYINQLIVPDGFEIETIQIKDAECITKAYNSAMQASDAKFKVYIHQDVFIINRNFILNLVELFANHQYLGMIGVVGSAQIPPNGAWWELKCNYGKIFNSQTGKMQLRSFGEINSEYQKVQCIDGSMMITQYDVLWRDDIFDGVHFYDIFQSVEFVRAGYEVGVPKQFDPWCIHDCGVPNMDGYERYRQIFLKEYAKNIQQDYTENKKPYSQLNGTNKIKRDIVLPLSKETEGQGRRDKLIKKTDNKVNYFNNREEYSKAQQILINAQDHFERLVKAAEAEIVVDNFEQAARAVMKAANFAQENHTGSYFSYRLEEILLKCATIIEERCKLSIANLPKKINRNNKRNVLHVLTEGYDTGGHTRLVARWCEQDNTSTHSVIALEPFQNCTPQWLANSAQQTGGWYSTLYQPNHGLCERAKILRNIAYSWADVVVLHTHPFDPIPIMAFGIDKGPPVIILNHADHVFWLGSSIADMVASIRPSAELLTLTRRGSKRSMLLPIPLALPKINISKDDAKKQLGIDTKQKVLLSIANPYKYVSSGDYDFIQMLRRIDKKHKNVVSLVVGPQDVNQWQSLRIATGNRAKAFGIQNNLDVFHSAADVYLDSFCLGSLTASLEVGIKGVPVICMANGISKILSIDDVSYQKAKIIASDLTEYEKKVDEMIKQPKLRTSIGNDLAKCIKEDHVDLWLQYLNKIYDSLPKEHSILTCYENISNWDDGDLLWTYLQNKIKE